MGTALAEAFLDKGHQVTVWNRSATLVAGSGSGGWRRGRGASQQAGRECLLVYDTVYEVFGRTDGALSRRTLVNLTNGTPEQARAMSEWAAGQGANYIDGGIMAVPPMIGRPEALILYSGSQTAFASHSRDLDAVGTSKYLGQDAGLAPLYEIALLAGMYGLFSGV